MVNHPDFPVISVSLQSQNKKQKPCQVEMPLQWVAVAHVDDSRNFETGLVIESVFLNHLHSLFKQKQNKNEKKKKSIQYRRLNNHVCSLVEINFQIP